MTKINAKVSNANMVSSAIREWYTQHQHGPSFRDLANMTGLSLGTVYSVCHELRDDGIINLIDGVARSIQMKEGK